MSMTCSYRLFNRWILCRVVDAYDSSSEWNSLCCQPYISLDHAFVHKHNTTATLSRSVRIIGAKLFLSEEITIAA